MLRKQSKQNSGPNVKLKSAKVVYYSAFLKEAVIGID